MSTGSDGLSYLTLDETSPEVVLNGYTNAALQLIYQHEEKTKKAASKKAIVNYLASAMRDVAAKAIVSNLSHSELKVLVDAAKISYGERNKPTKVVLKKRLYESLSKNGLQGFFEAIENHKLRTNAAALLCDAIEIEPQKSQRRTLEALSRELSNIGFQAFFDSYPSSKLHDICVELSLDNPNVHSKPELIKAIVERKAPKRLARRRSEPKFTKKKKPIVRGVTYHDLFQHYQVSELRDYCASKRLIKSGKKKVLINRILAFLDGDTETTVAPSHASKEKRPHVKSPRLRGSKKPKTSSRDAATEGDSMDDEGYVGGETEEPNETAFEGLSGTSGLMSSEEKKAWRRGNSRAWRKGNSLVDEEKEEEDEEEAIDGMEEELEEEDEDVDEEEEEEEEDEEDADEAEDMIEHELDAEGADILGLGRSFDDPSAGKLISTSEDEPSSRPSRSNSADHFPSLGAPKFAEEGAAVDRLDLDLDKLDEQPIEVLVEYCQDEGLGVGGKTKEHYIEAILAYNEVEEIDLDKLENHFYSMETLREYCTEEGLAANPNNENDMIRKILAYNDDAGCVPE